LSRVTRQDLVDMTDDPDLLFADGFDDAILGVASRCGQPTIVVYDRAKCIDILMLGNDLPIPTREIAEEYFAFNVEGAWIGPRTPAFLTRLGLDDGPETG
jgi:hypothetical protein